MPPVLSDFDKRNNCAVHGYFVGKVCPRCQDAKQYENRTVSKLPDAKPKEQARALGSDHEGKTSGARVPHVCFTLCRTRLLDVDAKYGSIKDLLDGLQYAGLISGDREGEITLEVNQVKVSHRSEEKTLISIELP